MYCGSGLYTDIPHRISNNMVLPVTLFLPLFLFPPDALRVRVSLGVSGVQCLTRSVFIPPEKCYCVYCMGCGVWAVPAAWGLLMNNLYVCWTPRIFPKKAWFSLSFTPNLLPLPLSWSWEKLTSFSPPGCNLCFTFQLFLSYFPHPPFHTAVWFFFMLSPSSAKSSVYQLLPFS